VSGALLFLLGKWRRRLRLGIVFEDNLVVVLVVMMEIDGGGLDGGLKYSCLTVSGVNAMVICST